MEKETRRNGRFDSSDFVREQVEIIYNRALNNSLSRPSTLLNSSPKSAATATISSQSHNQPLIERRQSTERRKTARHDPERRQKFTK